MFLCSFIPCRLCTLRTHALPPCPPFPRICTAVPPTPPGLPARLIRSHLLENSGTDVRPFIESNPFQPMAAEALTTATGAGIYEDGGGSVSCSPPEPSAAAAAARLSFLDAVELVLTTGPLSRGENGGGGGASAAAAAAAAAVSTAESSREAAGLSAGSRGGGGPGFQGFGRHVHASVVAAVVELLGAATSAAERWGLPPQERERLKAWSRAAAGASSPSVAC